MRFLSMGALLLAACGGRPMDDVGVVFVETGFAEGCFQANTAQGLARRVEGDVQIVLTPSAPGSFTFTSVAFVSGGTVVDETVSEVEAVYRVTPQAETTEIVLTAQLACSTQFGDTGSPEWRFHVLPSGLDDTWTPVSSL